MGSKLEFLLKEWGAWFEKHITWADEYGDNILYRAGFMGGKGGTPGHKILCPECPKSVQRINRAICRLPAAENEAIVSWYCFPYDDETGKKYTKQQVAGMLHISYHALDKRLGRARKKLRKSLHTV